MHGSGVHSAELPGTSREGTVQRSAFDLDKSIRAAAAALMGLQQADGHWIFELEADATIPAEYVLLRHYRGEPDDAALESKIAVYLRRRQTAQDGWPLFYGGEFNVSASVKAYFALKMIGDLPDADHMRRARDAIRRHGGAETCNVFTRVLLSLYGVIPWRSVPVMPVEIMLLPRWFPFHFSKVSYWARTVMVPLLVLQGLKPRAVNRRGIGIDELFVRPPATVGPPERAPHQSRFWFLLFHAVDAVMLRVEPFFPRSLRRRAVDRAVDFVVTRLNGEDGLGAIFPAMVNSVMMFDALGYPNDHPHTVVARTSVETLLAIDDREAYCQPCVSPVWDTALVCHVLLESGDDRARAAAERGLEWLVPRQVLDVAGDWSVRRPQLRPGGWAFQYANPHYPDLDDTAVVVMAMDRADRIARHARYDAAIARAREWISGLQSRNGGWAAFDVDNTHYYLNNIPFSDHGALLDPPSEDVTARCVSMLAQLGTAKDDAALAAALGYLRRTQREDGSWYGRWGMNYIYGTWSVLCALNAAGVSRESDEMRRGAEWLLAIQNSDGGWGEDGTSYRLDYAGYERAPSTASQTAWALLGLMAAGKVDDPAVARGVDYLMRTQTAADGFWEEERFTATGFPRVFYLRYHGYRKFFPLWALARYRDLTGRSSRDVAFGM